MNQRSISVSIIVLLSCVFVTGCVSGRGTAITLNENCAHELPPSLPPLYSISEKQLIFGEWGDPDYLKVNNRDISMRLITERVEGGHLVDRISITDVTELGSQDFTEGLDNWPLDRGFEGAFLMGRRYSLRYERRGPEILTLLLDDSTGVVAKNRDGGCLTLKQLRELRKQHALSYNRTVYVDGINLYWLPQSSNGEACFQFLHGTTFRVELLGCVTKVVEATTVKKSNSIPLGWYRGKYYLLEQVRDRWSFVEGVPPPQ